MTDPYPYALNTSPERAADGQCCIDGCGQPPRCAGTITLATGEHHTVMYCTPHADMMVIATRGINGIANDYRAPDRLDGPPLRIVPTGPLHPMDTIRQGLPDGYRCEAAGCDRPADSAVELDSATTHGWIAVCLRHGTAYVEYLRELAAYEEAPIATEQLSFCDAYGHAWRSTSIVRDLTRDITSGDHTVTFQVALGCARCGRTGCRTIDRTGNLVSETLDDEDTP